MSSNYSLEEKKESISLPTVSNVKVKHIRPKYQDLKEWCEDESNLYIGRRGIVFVTIEGKKQRYPPRDSIWANPFKIGKDGTREEVTKKYEEYVRELIQNKKVDIKELEGKNLGCWCKPDSCHGDILVQLVKEYNRR